VAAMHLWAMQPMWNTATIELRPYKDPCHCKSIAHFNHTVVTLHVVLLGYHRLFT